MPRLLAFLPCEKVILGQDNAASVISILQTVQISFKAEPSPADSERDLPIRWSVLALWHRAEEPPENYEQKIVLSDPNHQSRLELITRFSMEKDNHRIVGEMHSFPVAPEGRYSLSLSWRRLDDRDWIQVAEYPINLTYAPMPAHSPTQ